MSEMNLHNKNETVNDTCKDVCEVIENVDKLCLHDRSKREDNVFDKLQYVNFMEFLFQDKDAKHTCVNVHKHNDEDIQSYSKFLEYVRYSKSEMNVLLDTINMIASSNNEQTPDTEEGKYLKKLDHSSILHKKPGHEYLKNLMLCYGLRIKQLKNIFCLIRDEFQDLLMVKNKIIDPWYQKLLYIKFGSQSIETHVHLGNIKLRRTFDLIKINDNLFVNISFKNVGSRYPKDYMIRVEYPDSKLSEIEVKDTSTMFNPENSLRKGKRYTIFISLVNRETGYENPEENVGSYHLYSDGFIQGSFDWISHFLVSEIDNIFDEEIFFNLLNELRCSNLIYDYYTENMSEILRIKVDKNIYLKISLKNVYFKKHTDLHDDNPNNYSFISRLSIIWLYLQTIHRFKDYHRRKHDPQYGSCGNSITNYDPIVYKLIEIIKSIKI